MSPPFLREMHPHHQRLLTGIALGCLILLLGWMLWPSAKPRPVVSGGPLEVPVVMHTSGGRLEVATVTVTESFKLTAPAKSFLGIDLGETVSQIQAKVVHRFYIEMAKEWPVRFKGTTAIIEAGEIKPTLPVAFDTSTLEKYTTNSWARFDKQANLAELEKRMSPELEKRSYGYRALALPYARKSVADFAKTWLAKDPSWKALNITEIKVLFPGEPSIEDTTLRPHPADQ